MTKNVPIWGFVLLLAATPAHAQTEGMYAAKTPVPLPFVGQSLTINPAIISVNAAALVQSPPSQSSTSGRQLRRHRTLKFVVIGAGIGFTFGAWLGREFGGDTDVRTGEIWKGGLKGGALGAGIGFVLSQR